MSHAAKALEGLCNLGMRMALLVGREGFLIDAVTGNPDAADGPDNSAVVAAVAASAWEASRLMATDLMRANVTGFFVELDNGGAIVAQQIIDDVLAVVLTENVATLGRLRMELRRLAPVIKRALTPEAPEPPVQERPQAEKSPQEPKGERAPTFSASRSKLK